MAFDTKRSGDVVTLQASTTVTATGNGDPVQMPGFRHGVVTFYMIQDVTAAATVAADTLDVFIQTKADGANWLDVVHFTQIAGDGGAKRRVMRITATANTTNFEASSALADNAVRNIFGDEWRVRWAVVSDTGPSFTFGVTACPQ